MTSAYGRSGVRTTEELRDFPRMLDVLRGTFAARGERSGRPILEFGQYANVLDLGNNLGLAISTDGVGTKILIAEALGKFDTIGIDCIAMNVNDVICVGAEPIAMTDYVAVHHATGELLSELAIGLARGAELSDITIPGGEIAQVPEMVTGLDLVGTCVGLVPIDKVIDGRHVRPGDAVIGFSSSGIHSNGMTLARRVLLEEGELSLQQVVPELGRTLGEELLEPTNIYVRLALDLLSRIDVHGLAHITSDGFLNLARVQAEVGFEITDLPPVPPIFDLIQRVGNLPAAEMFLVYNMGIGFCCIVPEEDAAVAVELGNKHGFAAMRIGTSTGDRSKTVSLPRQGLRSLGGHFVDQ